jgi:hypothetical protein
LNASVDLRVPSRFGIGISGAVEAGEQLRRDFRTGVRFKTQGVGKHGLGRFRHEPILRFRRPANNRLQPAAAGAMISRRG